MTAWQSKVVVITGGSAGLGLSIARAFLSRGAKVVIAGRDAQRLSVASESLASELNAGDRVTSFVCDVTSDSDVASLKSNVLAKWNRVDVLVNNVGKSTRGRLLETTVDEHREFFELNFLTAVRCTQVFSAELIQQRGHIVNIGSLASKLSAPYLGAYCTSKFPLAAFSQQLRLELLGTGVHVMLVCPGPIRRSDAGSRYNEAANLPDAAKKPGGGVKLKGIDPDQLASLIVGGCERGKLELVVPGYSRLLMAISQVFPALGDWIIRKKTGN